MPSPRERCTVDVEVSRAKKCFEIAARRAALQGRMVVSFWDSLEDRGKTAISDLSVGNTATRTSRHAQASRHLQASKHLCECARKELNALARLSASSGTFSLANDGWRLLLTVLVANHTGINADTRSVADSLSLCPGLVLRYCQVLEADRLVVLSCNSHSDRIASLSAHGLVTILRYFSPEPAND